MLTNMPRPSTRASGLRALAHANQAPMRASHYGQTRGFRFRAWSTYLDPEFQRQLRQRQRQISYKYMESINRKLSLDPSSRGEDPRMVLKKIMNQCWISHGHTQSRGTHVKEDKVNCEHNPGTRPGQNIEDVERGALNALFSSKRAGTYEYDLWQSPLQNIRNYLGSQIRAKSTTSASRDADVEIDPITNRRVKPDLPKATHEPFYEDGPPPAEELKQYGRVPLDGTPWADSGDAGPPQYADLDKYTPVMDETLDAKQHQQQLPREPKYDDLEKYKPVGLEDFIEDTEPSSKSKYEDLHKYANPSLTEGTPEELSQPAYEDLDKYQPVMHNEDSDVQGAVEKYDDLDKYGPVMHNENNDGAVERSTAYDDLHKYGPSGFNEPEGARPLTDEEKSKDYDDLHKYGPMGYNEPHGKAPVHPEEASKAYPDLDQYGPMAYNEPHGQAPMHPEEASKAYTDLEKYEPVGWNEPHGQPPMHPEEASKEYSDLNTYGPVAFVRGDGHLPESVVSPIAPADWGKYKPVHYDEPESQRPKPDWDQTTFDEAKKYQSYRYNEPNGQPIEKIDPVSEGLSDFDAEIAAKANMRILNTYGTSTVAATATEKERADDLDLLRASDIRAKIPTSSGQSRREYSTTNRQVLEDDLPRYSVNWDISSKAARVSLRKARSKAWESIQSKSDLTGNYVKDFPEDFSKSWSTVIAESPKAVDDKYQSPKGDEVEAASFDESFPRLEPAMNRASAFKPRASKKGTSDSYSTEPQGLELSYTEETGGQQTWPAYVRSYGTATDLAANPTGPTGTTAAAAKPDLREPIVYKILAYDPTMQSITSAETTSMVPDNAATPLTPADVLLRLSNPTKFFPYFSPLQKEGYEIVSGSGDVLVFRKVRDAEVLSGGQEQSAAPIAQTPMMEKSTTYQAPKVNPIDMMGSDPVVPSAYSSSPTGYLNYDYPGAEAEDKPPPPFSSLRRRHTISCDTQDYNCRRPRMSRARRVILGAASLGGISYAVGVVGEYFKTGGHDGRGPKGL